MASPTTRSLEERFEFLKQQIIGQKKTAEMKEENVLKRILYADCELLRMDIEDDKEFLNSDTGIQMQSDLKSYCELLNIGTVKRKGHVLDIFDELLRLVSVCFCLISFAVFFAVPSIMLYPLDKVLLRYGLVDRSYQSTVLIKRVIGKCIIMISGIDAHVQGLDEKTFAKSKNLAFYSHGSTLDPFIIAATCPVRHLSIAKSDLFLVPYFAWLMYALGAIAIDRSNRDTAVLALKKAASTMTDDDCVTVAPEGKRSTTGQLLEFKKGPFHLWYMRFFYYC
jgi:1-acyl-sn-glycerol-3-phosphate acyltransferase